MWLTRSEIERLNSMAKMESVHDANGDYGVDNTCTVGNVGMLNTDEESTSLFRFLLMCHYCRDIVCYLLLSV